jgi:hypothetical protein
VITFGTDTSLTTGPGWDNVTGVGLKISGGSLRREKIRPDGHSTWMDFRKWLAEVLFPAVVLRLVRTRTKKTKVSGERERNQRRIDTLDNFAPRLRRSSYERTKNENTDQNNTYEDKVS